MLKRSASSLDSFVKRQKAHSSPRRSYKHNCNIQLHILTALLTQYHKTIQHDGKVGDGQINCKIYTHSGFQKHSQNLKQIETQIISPISQTCRQKVNTSVTKSMTEKKQT